MEAIKLETVEQFEGLKKGDFIIVRWSDYNMKHNKGMKKIMGYSIVENKPDYKEIICRKAGNHYFNYSRVIEGLSGAEEVMLVKQ